LPGQLIREWETLGPGKTMLESRQSNPLTHNCRPGGKTRGKTAGELLLSKKYMA